jgi:hypothetical protein
MNYYEIIFEGEYANYEDSIISFKLLNEKPKIDNSEYYFYYTIPCDWGDFKGNYIENYILSISEHIMYIKEEYLVSFIEEYKGNTEFSSNIENMANLIEPVFRNYKINKLI